ILFLRNNRQVELTDAGEKLLPFAQQKLDAMATDQNSNCVMVLSKNSTGN
ncbi:hypothetical protein AAUPMC_13391, partial [Pasteurella multocida subsp. multocida str. Anand1_cattle]